MDRVLILKLIRPVKVSTQRILYRFLRSVSTRVGHCKLPAKLFHKMPTCAGVAGEIPVAALKMLERGRLPTILNLHR